MRVVLDTNTLASGALALPDSPAAAILDAWRAAAFTLVVSADIIAELAGVLQKPYFASRLRPDDRATLLELIRTAATIVEIVGSVSGVASHPEDDRILECALSGEARFLVTGDKALLSLDEFEQVRIISPRRFWDVLKALTSR